MKDIFSRLSQIGLKEVTSKVQKKHLTRAFKDKRLPDVFYSFHAGTGYVRRYFHGDKYSTRCYQLNPRSYQRRSSYYEGKEYKCTVSERIGVWNEMEACIIIMQHAIQYREKHLKTTSMLVS